MMMMTMTYFAVDARFLSLFCLLFAGPASAALAANSLWVCGLWSDDATTAASAAAAVNQRRTRPTIALTSSSSTLTDATDPPRPYPHTLPPPPGCIAPHRTSDHLLLCSCGPRLPSPETRRPSSRYFSIFPQRLNYRFCVEQYFLIPIPSGVDRTLSPKLSWFCDEVGTPSSLSCHVVGSWDTI